MKTSLRFQSPSSVQEPVKHMVDEKHKDVNTFEPRCKPKKNLKGSYTEVNPISINQSHW